MFLPEVTTYFHENVDNNIEDELDELNNCQQRETHVQTKYSADVRYELLNLKSLFIVQNKYQNSFTN